MIETGMTAPQFSLYNTERVKINLADQRGTNVLLLFFPAAFTSVCTEELCAARDAISMYAAANAKVFGISVDSLFTLTKYKEDQRLNFDLLSDFNKDVSKAYGTLYETFAFEMQGVSKRSAFIIDEAGIVQYAEVLENAGALPNFEIIQESLGALKS
ncbi:MAG TPA: redoxin domain-containing protein [Chitinophagaceae bacterium]|nr:redoxin domain-containing protein [Chitinophagaceae bacterium]